MVVSTKEDTLIEKICKEYNPCTFHCCRWGGRQQSQSRLPIDGWSNVRHLRKGLLICVVWKLYYHRLEYNSPKQNPCLHWKSMWQMCV